MFQIFLLLFIVVPTVEIYILIQAGKVIGGWQTVFLVLLTGVVGAYLSKSQGRTVWRRLQTELSMGRPPGDALLDGVCVLIGGILLMTPGFVTDAFGLILLLPPAREPVKRLMRRWIEKRLAKGVRIIWRKW